jgi:hypothetical protein
MDILTINPADYTDCNIVNDILTVKWIERYREPGEFSITAYPTDAIRTRLALGTLVTHLETQDVMMVEDHEIDESGDADPVITITGRSLTAFLENRIASPNNLSLLEWSLVTLGTSPNQYLGYTDTPRLYNFTADTTVNITKRLIRDQIGNYSTNNNASGLTSSRDALPRVEVISTFVGTDPVGAIGTDPSKDLVVTRGPLLPEVLKLLERMDAGLKIMRPIAGTSSIVITFQIHKGIDKSETAIFSNDFGDLEETRYFWTNRNYKTSVVVNSAYYIKVMRPTTGTGGFNERVIYLDASDAIPEGSPRPDGAATTDAQKLIFENILTRRGEEALGASKLEQYLETSITPNSRLKYRKDYNIGDLVYIRGNYGVSTKMRVVEYAEFEDATGESGVPTVKAI